MNSTPLYSLRVPEVYQALESSPAGLKPEEVAARQELYGSNRLAEPQAEPAWRRLAAHATHPLGLLLILAGGLAFAVGEPVPGLVIWLLVLVNGGLAFWREHRAEEAMDALGRLLPAYARVLRAGQEVQVVASGLVPGDVLILAEGDNIPADARVVEAFGLRTNNATLTGEAAPALKTADASFREGISELERPNLIFTGTSIVSGTGQAVVYATGMLTQFGRIARLTQAVREEPSPLQQELIRITRVISLAALVIGGVVFTVGVFDIRLELFEAFLLALGIIVALVPEGLPATITLSLAMAAQRLAQRGVLVKKLSILDTLGTVSLICTDKSGTLTQNQMTVREVWVAGQRFSVSGAGYDPAGAYLPAPTQSPAREDLLALLSAAALCNNSRLIPPALERARWGALGDPTEAALRVAALKGGLEESALAAGFPRTHELPFDARRKRMSTVHRLAGEAGPVDGRAAVSEIAFVKGAPREVLALCTHILCGGEARPLDETQRAEILAANDEYARGALRVLALARRILPANRPGGRQLSVESVERELTFLGLMAMMDPPREEVRRAVEVCREAGIRMVMITGDYGLTAESLARRVGLLSSPDVSILTGAELDTLDEDQLADHLQGETVFARMAPEHKLRLVAAFQARGHVVAVTGDGVNDAPALRKADVGVAMGITGTDVAKEAADVILTDDNFARLTSAIEEGRAVYDNLRKFITYIFSSNVPEVAPFLLTALFPLVPLALTVSQILAIDLGTDLFPALALGVEKPEPNVMRRPPRRREQPLVDNRLLRRAFLWLGLIETVLCFAGFFIVYFRVGVFDSLQRLAQQWPALGWAASTRLAGETDLYLLAVTVFHAGVVMAQVGNAFACRTELERSRRIGWLSNPQLVVGVAVEIVLILLLIYVPPLARAFDHYPLPPVFWLGLGLYGPVLYTLDWLRKTIARRKLETPNGSVTRRHMKESL
jgi:magnesium-transporting ATPase (P-type)